MAQTDVNPRWQDAMSKYTPANVRPDEAAGTMEHYFVGAATFAPVLPLPDPARRCARSTWARIASWTPRRRTPRS